MSIKPNLRKEAGEAIMWNAFGQYSIQFLGFLTAAVLARLLTPEDFGLIGMILVVNTFLAIFANAGLVPTIVQHRDFSARDISSLWGLALLIGVASGLALVLAGPGIARFFGDGRLTVISLWIAPSLFLTALSQVPRGILQRDLRFKPLAWASFITALIASLAAIWLGFKGWGYWALVAQMLLRNGLLLIALFGLVRPIGMPAFDRALYRRILGYTGNLTLFQLVNYVHRNLDNLLIGRFLGAAMLGFYSRAYLLMSTIGSALAGVVSPVLHAAMARKVDELVIMRRAYAEVLTIIIWICAPLMGLLAGLSPLVIQLVWGHGWSEAAVPFFWLALAGMHQPVFGTVGTVFAARNRTRGLLYSGIINSCLLGLAIASGLRDGIDGVARNYSVMSHLIFLPFMYYVWCRLLEGRFSAFLKLSLPPFITGWAGALAGWHILSALSAGEGIPTAAMLLVAWAAAFLLLAWRATWPLVQRADLPLPGFLLKAFLAPQAMRRKVLKYRYRKATSFHNGREVVPFLSPDAGNQLIAERIRSGEPLMVARHGKVELRYLYERSPARLRVLCNNAGFFPADPELGKRFIGCYEDACRELDILALVLYRHGLFPEEQAMFRNFSPQARLIDLQCLSPFLFQQPWSAALEGKRVLVVHPFSESIRNQYHRNRAALFRDPSVLPAFAKLDIVPAVQSIGGGHPDHKDWFSALEAMKREIDACEYDVALLGCGAYGLPLAAHVKRSGKQAIYMGGVLQLLFGIKGKRWEGPSYAYDKRFYNELWARPMSSEIPDSSDSVEGGCNW